MDCEHVSKTYYSRAYVGRDELEIVVVGQFLANFDAILACKDGHARISIDSPFLDAAVWVTRVIDEAGCGAFGCSIDDQTLVECHQVIMLWAVSY